MSAIAGQSGVRMGLRLPQHPFQLLTAPVTLKVMLPLINCEELSYMHRASAILHRGIDFEPPSRASRPPPPIIQWCLKRGVRACCGGWYTRGQEVCECLLHSLLLSSIHGGYWTQCPSVPDPMVGSEQQTCAACLTPGPPSIVRVPKPLCMTPSPCAHPPAPVRVPQSVCVACMLYFVQFFFSGKCV